MNTTEIVVQKKHTSNIRVLITSALMFCFLIACDTKKKEYIDQPYDGETIPSMNTDSVTTLISDSGIVRYKVVTAEWLVFDNASDPHWYFPEGLYLEQFDTLFNKQVTLVADTAWNYTRQKRWVLKGKVFIRNINNETFSSEELIWDEREQKVKSDRYIEINRPNKLMLKGFGFESNQNMTQYKVFRPFDTEIIVDEKTD